MMLPPFIFNFQQDLENLLCDLPNDLLLWLGKMLELLVMLFSGASDASAGDACAGLAKPLSQR